MSSLNDESLLLEFVAESRDHLASIEPDLLVLEREGENAGAEIINRVFRAIHSIKGASGFFGLEALKSLSHSMENVLMMMRDGKILPSPAVMDPLLVGVDRLREMLDDVQASENIPYSDLVDQLEAIIANGGAPSATEPVALQATPDPEATTPVISRLQPDRLAVETAARHGQRLFAIQVYMDQDLTQKNRSPLQFMDQLLSTGNILDTALDISQVETLDGSLEDTRLPLTFLYASVLEIFMLAISLDLPESQFQELTVAQALSEESTESVAPPTTTQASDATTNYPSATETTTDAPTVATGAAATASGEPVHPRNPEKTAKAGNSGEETVRVKVDLLNRLMDLAGEMVLARNQLVRTLDTSIAKSNGLSSIIQNVDLVTSDLQEHIMQTRMQPIASVFGKFPRVVRDLSRQLGKEIELFTTGDDVELDKSILESLSDPLTHLIRNCCDHALETPEERTRNGKSRTGAIYLKAYQESGHINIAISDDGRGIDAERIAQKAIKNGAISEAEVRKMSPQEQVNLIFLPGLSTAEKITDVSGRGVGMDVVRTNIEQIGGHISVETELGQGTTILLRLPLTLAIIPSLVVGVCNQTFALPQINLVELVSVRPTDAASRISRVGSAPVLRLRGNLLPLVHLADVLNLERQYQDPLTAQALADGRKPLEPRRQKQEITEEMVGETEDGLMTLKERRNQEPERRQHRERSTNILVLKSGNNQYGLIVDEIRDMEEIVVKPLSGFVKSCRCFSGATIMGDGRVAMILDVGGIVSTSGLSFTEINAEQERFAAENTDSSYRDNTERQAIILFNNALEEIFAIPLDSVLRLEKFQLADVERMGSRRFLPYRGKGLQLLFLEDHLPVGYLPAEQEEAYLIIPKSGDMSVGIVASRILDTTEVSTKLESAYVDHPGVSGSALVDNHLTLFIEPDNLLRAAGLLNINSNTKRSTEWQADPLQPSY